MMSNIPCFVTYWALRDLADQFREVGFVTLALPPPAAHFVTHEAQIQEVVSSFVT